MNLLHWAGVWGTLFNVLFLSSSLEWTESQLRQVEPSEFQELPGVVLSSWRIAINRVHSSNNNNNNNNNNNLRETNDSLLAKNFCELIFIAETRVQYCLVTQDEGGEEEEEEEGVEDEEEDGEQGDDEEGGNERGAGEENEEGQENRRMHRGRGRQIEVNVYDPNLKTSVVSFNTRDSGWEWLSKGLSRNHSNHPPHAWTKLVGERKLGYVQKLSHGQRPYRVGLKIPFSLWMVDPCSKENANLLCDPLSSKCISGGGTSVLNTNFSCECLDWYVEDVGRGDEEGEGGVVGLVRDGASSGKCVRGDWLTRNILRVIQAVAIALALGVAIATFVQRKTKVLSSSMWPVTEVIVIGSILLYVTILLRSVDQPSNTACIMEPWLRELGFSLCYGAIVLKIYRALVEFRTRKAHRWVVREKDIIRYLSAIFAVVIFYMTAWTVTNSTKIPNADHICPITWWHRVTEIGELLFLGVGLHMAYHLRNAQAPWNERRYYSAALLIETFASITTMVLRETRVYMDTNESLFLLVLYFARSHMATTVILLIVFAPKFYYIQDEKKKRLVRRSDGGTTRVVKALDAINGDLDLAEVNLADMDPQDIRSELKRVYTQLELLRNKTMRKDNPHISKRRGGRKPTHRRFSLQALHRRNQRSFRYHGDDIEDSVCSIEGPSTYSEAGR